MIRAYKDLRRLAKLFLEAPQENWPNDPPQPGDICQSQDHWYIWIGKSGALMITIDKPTKKKDQKVNTIEKPSDLLQTTGPDAQVRPN